MPRLNCLIEYQDKEIELVRYKASAKSADAVKNFNKAKDDYDKLVGEKQNLEEKTEKLIVEFNKLTDDSDIEKDFEYTFVGEDSEYETLMRLYGEYFDAFKRGEIKYSEDGEIVNDEKYEEYITADEIKEYEVVFADFQEKLKQRKKRINGFIADFEKAEKKLDEYDKKISSSKKALDEAQVKYDDFMKAFDKRAAEIKKELDAAAKAIPTDIKNQFNIVRKLKKEAKEKDMRVMSKIVDGKCSICKAPVSKEKSKAIGNNENVVFCDNCERILYR